MKYRVLDENGDAIMRGDIDVPFRRGDVLRLWHHENDRPECCLYQVERVVWDLDARRPAGERAYFEVQVKRL